MITTKSFHVPYWKVSTSSGFDLVLSECYINYFHFVIYSEIILVVDKSIFSKMRYNLVKFKFYIVLIY